MRLIPSASVRCEIYEQKYLDQCLAVTFRQTISHVHFTSCVLWGPKYLTTFTKHLLCEWHTHGPVDMQRKEVLPLPVSKRQEGPGRVWVSSIDSSPGLTTQAHCWSTLQHLWQISRVWGHTLNLEHSPIISVLPQSHPTGCITLIRGRENLRWSQWQLTTQRKELVTLYCYKGECKQFACKGWAPARTRPFKMEREHEKFICSHLVTIQRILMEGKAWFNLKLEA